MSCNNIEFSLGWKYIDNGYYNGTVDQKAKACGKGTWTSDLSDKVYKGYWKDDKFHGYGKLSYYSAV